MDNKKENVSENLNFALFWEETMSQIRNTLSEKEYTMWFGRLDYKYTEENTVYVTAPSLYIRDQIKKRYHDMLEKQLTELVGVDIEIIFKIEVIGERAQSKKESISTPAIKKTAAHPQLNKDYSFETFVIGENNSLAANAALAISQNLGTSYNPCLIYGGVGLGKTHLIQSIGNHSHSLNSKLKIIYITMETFTSEFINSIMEKKTKNFKSRYRNADLLLIDDIHFIQKKPETQEELFHTFNSMYDANKQMVFTCDRPVSEIKDITERLRNRFERGLNVDLQPPSYETRYAILSKKIERSRIEIPKNVIELICNGINTNVRDLEAALTKLIAYSNIVDKKIDLEIANKLLKDFFISQNEINISARIVQEVIADYFNITINDMRGKKRSRQYTFPRQIAMYIIRNLTEFSTTEIGNEFNRDHTTVMHSCQKIEEKILADSTIKNVIEKLIQKINTMNSSN